MARGRNKNKQTTAMVTYRGPIAARSGVQPDSVRVVLKDSVSISSTAAGYIELYVDTSTASTTPEWSSFAATFREYRVLGIRLEWVPNYDPSGYVGSARAYEAGAGVAYHGPPPAWKQAVTSSSVQKTWQMENAIPWHPCKRTLLEWRMGDVEEAQFFNTSASSALGGIYAVSGTVTGSVPFGKQFTTFLVEFKGRV